MKAKTLFLFLLFASSPAYAVPVFLKGDFISTQITDDGTLGNSALSPGLLHDPTGSGDFSLNDDYLQPGTPWEFFAVKINGAVYDNFNNSGRPDLLQGSVIDQTNFQFDNQAFYVGGNELVTVTTTTGFNNDDENIQFITTLTARVDLEDVEFVRGIDPDPDINRFGSFQTLNTKGLDLNNDGDYDDDGEISPDKLVSSVGLSSGQAIGLYTDSTIASNTGIGFNSSDPADPSFFLNGGTEASGSIADLLIGLAFAVGDLSAGESIDLTYSYVFGDSLNTISIPVNPGHTEVPEPATALLLLGGLMAAKRKLN